MQDFHVAKEPPHTLDDAERRPRRFGLRLFVAYLFVYAGFIAISAFYHTTLAYKALFGLNIAVLYGFGLIGLAFLLALVFLFAGGQRDTSSNSARKRV